MLTMNNLSHQHSHGILSGVQGLIDKFKPKRRRRMFKNNPMFNYEIFMKKKALDTIMLAKGYESWTEFARALGVTKNYLSNVKSGKVGVSHVLMVRIAVLLGNEKYWHIFYEMKPSNRKMQNYSKIMNVQKYEGVLPYAADSVAGNSRKQDSEVEFEPRS